MKNICFFTSIGDDLNLIEYIHTNHNYDIVCNYYGDNDLVFKDIQNIAKYAEKNKLCKFPSIKKLSSHIDNYDYIIIYDDDAIIKNGSIQDLLDIAIRYNLDIISCSQDPNGKISWKIHLPEYGNHTFRYVNFIEINFPIFSKQALKKFMLDYDGILCDWGVDYWYSHILQPETNMNMAIVDRVMIHNPKNSIRLNSVVDPHDRVKQMNKYLVKYNIPQIKPKVLGYV